MIERLIYLAIKLGLERGLKDPLFLERHLRKSMGPKGVTVIEAKRMVRAIQAAFTGHPRPVIHHYARTDGRFPLWAIVLGDEHEDMSLLGSFGGYVPSNAEAPEGAGAPANDPDADKPVMAAFEAHTFHVLSYSEHPDFSLLMYYLSKAFVRRAHLMFVRAGLAKISVGGGDLTPELDFVPTGLFARRLTVQCASQQEVVGDLDPAEERAFDVDVVDLEAVDPVVLDAETQAAWDILPSS